MAKIKQITASEILDAKGNLTIQATVVLDDGKIGVASCPTSDVIGNYDAFTIKDPMIAINNINNTVTSILIGKDAENQQGIDKAMIDFDGTQNKARLGANAMFPVSMAIAKASAESSVLPLFLYLRQFVKKDKTFIKIPIPMFNMIAGDKKRRGLADFNEFLVVPASSKTYTECIQIGEKIYKSLKQVLEMKNSETVGDYDEGFSPNLVTNKEAFSLIQQAVENAQLGLGFDVFFGLNARASLFYENQKYKIKDLSTPLSSKDLINYYEELNRNVHLLYLEDPLAPNDWGGWNALFEKLATTTIIAGGDLVATNPFRMQMALEKKTINGVVIKPNQIGTVIEALAVAQAAKEMGLKLIVSHTSNETNDDFIADFAVAVSADYIKIGNIIRGENIAKYNRLLQIENQLKIL